MSNVGVIVGRFQVAELHEEHRRVIDLVYNRHPMTIIFLGVSSFKTSKNNPLDFEARRSMLAEAYPNAIILFLPDYPSDNKWSAELDNQINSIVGYNSVVTLYGGRDSFIKHYTGKFPTKEIKPERYVSGEECRSHLGESIKRSKDFRHGVIWATQNQYTRVFPTVDITVLYEDKILVAKKKEENKYRFIGGFVEASATSLEDEATRELYEESSLKVPNESLKYVCSYNVPDWRTYGQKEKIITTFFLSKITEHQIPVAGDDIEWCGFESLNSLNNDMFSNTHQFLFRKLKEHINHE